MSSSGPEEGELEEGELPTPRDGEEGEAGAPQPPRGAAPAAKRPRGGDCPPAARLPPSWRDYDAPGVADGHPLDYEMDY